VYVLLEFLIKMGDPYYEPTIVVHDYMPPALELLLNFTDCKVMDASGCLKPFQ